MDKKKKILIITELALILIFLIFIGSISGSGIFYGDINMIDEGQNAAWGSHMVSGEKVFKDFFISYGPLNAYQYYLLFNIFGQSVFVMRAFTYLFLIFVSLILIRLLLNKLFNYETIRMFTLFLLTIIPGVNIRQSIGFFVIYVLFNSFNKKSVISSIYVGILLAVSFLYSPEIGIFLFIICILYFIYKGILEKNIMIVIKKLVVMVSSITIAGIIFAYWSGTEGWLNSYLKSTKDILFEFSGINSPNGKNFPNALNSIQTGNGMFEFIRSLLSKDMLLYWALFYLISAALYILVRVTIRKFTAKDEMIALVTIYGILLYTNIIGRSGHFFLIMPIIIIISIYFIENLLHTINYRKDKYIWFFGVFLISIQVLFFVRVISIFRPQFHKIIDIPAAIFTQKNNPEKVGHILISDNQKQYIKEMQTFIWKNTTSRDSVYFLTNEAMMYMLANRTNPSRYDLPFVAHTLEKRLEVLEDLKKNRPKYIFADKKAWSVDEVSNQQRLPEVMNYINSSYKPCKNIMSTQVYCRQ